MDVSIILVNYNLCRLTTDCIRSIYDKVKDLKYEIFVVDNDSHDNSFEILRNTFPNIKLIKNDVNIGFGRANNVAIKQAQGKYVFLLNADTTLINNAVKILFDFMENNISCGACGGNLYSSDAKMIHSFGYGDDVKSMLLRKTPLKLLFWKEYRKIKDYEKKSDKTKLQRVNHITGADLMIRKSVLDEVGIFSDKFFLYFEETELENRIKKAGYEIWFVPESKIIHLEGKSHNSLKDKYFIESYIEYYRSSYGLFWGNIAFLLQLPRIIKLSFEHNIKKVIKNVYSKEKQGAKRKIKILGFTFQYDKNDIKMTKIGKHCILKNVQLLGANIVYPNAKIWSKYKNTIRIGRGTSIGQGTSISNHEKPGHISIGENTSIGYNNDFYGQAGIEIGNEVITASNVCILTSNHGYVDVNTPIIYQDSTYKPVKIGDESWIGYNVIILPNVTIGKHCVIGAGSVVTKSIPDYSIAAGNPCKIIKKYNKDTIKWEKIPLQEKQEANS